MNTQALSLLVRHSARNVTAGGLPFLFSVLMCGAGLFSLGAFANFMINFEALTGSVSQRIRAVCFLDAENIEEAKEIQSKINATGDVEETILVTPDEAMARLQGTVDSGEASLTELGIKMPFIVEAVPLVGSTRRAFGETLRTISGVDEVMHPSGDVDRIHAVLKLVRGTGIFFSILISLVVIVVVSNAVRLTLFTRRDEITIMKLVGATDGFVKIPYIFGGATQGLLGGILAALALAATGSIWSSLFSAAFVGTLGFMEFSMFPMWASVSLALSGGLLGALGGLASIGRFLKV